MRNLCKEVSKENFFGELGRKEEKKRGKMKGEKKKEKKKTSCRSS